VSQEDPFTDPVETRRPERRLRGRLVVPVTVWTAGMSEERCGLTVSSVIVIDGDPAQVVGAIDPLSDLREMIESTGCFVVHVLDEGDQRLAAMFAGTYPLRPFEDLEVEAGSHGPVIGGERTVAHCRFQGAERVGYLDLVRGSIERIDIAPHPASPLAFYRGHYRRLEPGAPPS
jgi:flavin reductase (DIM6/NTAB) family NADH-FMN oxidoreductase RutF